MKKTKFNEEQILFVRKQGSAGEPISDVCRQMRISEAIYNVWKNRYTDLGIVEIRELRQLRSSGQATNFYVSLVNLPAVSIIYAHAFLSE